MSGCDEETRVALLVGRRVEGMDKVGNICMYGRKVV